VKVVNTIILVATLGAIRIRYATGLVNTLHPNDCTASIKCGQVTRPMY
jgi:hypothetical protein